MQGGSLLAGVCDVCRALVFGRARLPPSRCLSIPDGESVGLEGAVAPTALSPDYRGEGEMSQRHHKSHTAGPASSGTRGMAKSRDFPSQYKTRLGGSLALPKAAPTRKTSDSLRLPRLTCNLGHPLEDTARQELLPSQRMKSPIENYGGLGGNPCKLQLIQELGVADLPKNRHSSPAPSNRRFRPAC